MVRETKELIRQTNELSTIIGATYCEILFCQILFFPSPDEQHDSLLLSSHFQLYIVCEPPLYGTGSGDQSQAYKSLPTHWLLESIQGHNWKAEIDFKYPSGWTLVR